MFLESNTVGKHRIHLVVRSTLALWVQLQFSLKQIEVFIILVS